MPLYLDTRGNASAAIAICMRCSQKHPIGYFVGDGNIGPTFRVCPSCRDNFDPWRLPARKTENITLRYPRPDVPLDGFSEASQPLLGIDFILGVSTLGAA